MAEKAATKKPATTGVVKEAVRAPQFRVESAARKERYLKLMIYGNYGVGKTTLAASASEVPSMKDVVLINAEAGDLSLNEEQDIDSIKVQTFFALGRVNEYLKQHCKARDEDDEDFLIKSEAFVKGEEEADVEKRGPRRYYTCILDTLSELEAYCMNQLLGVTAETRLDEEVMSAEWAEYKKNNTMMLRVVRAFRDLPMHVIFTCAEKYNQDETKKYKYVPDMTGQLSKKVQGFMDMVGYYQMAREGDEVQRRLSVMPNAAGRFDAKHRYQAFKGEFFTDPTIGSILKDVGLLNKDGTPLK